MSKKKCGRCGGEVEDAIFINNDSNALGKYKVLKEKYGHICRDCIEEIEDRGFKG